MRTVRPASLNEQRFIISEALGLSHCVIIAARYTGELSPGDQLESVISNAVRHCINEHPVLSTNIQDAQGDHPQLTQVDTIDLADHHLIHAQSLITGKTEEQRVKSFLESAHHLRLPPAGERPQWCVYVGESLPTEPDANVVSFYLAFVFSHVFTDGMSGIAFHKTFLRAINGGMEPEHGDGDYQQAAKTPLPPVETAGNLTISWSYLLSILAQEFLPTWLASALGVQVDNPSEFWTGPSRALPELTPQAGTSPTAIEVALLTSSTVSRVLRACRRHECRMTSLLNYLTARALCKSLHARGRAYHKVKVGSAIDLRRVLGKGQGAMANWVSVFLETISVAERDRGMTEDAWESIKRSTNHLARASGSLADQPIGLIRYITNMKQWTQERASQPATVSFGTSNLGIFDGNEGEGGEVEGSSGWPWRVDAVIPSQSGSLTGAPFDVNAASAKDGSMSVVVSWWPGRLGLGVSDERAFICEILDEVKAGMEVME